MATPVEFTLGQNARYTVKDGVLTIVVDLNQQGVPSKTGNSLLVANSGGFQILQGFVSENVLKANLTITRK